VIIDFGILDSGAGLGYYVAGPVDLCDADLAITLPVDGQGAYEGILANGFDTTYIYLATCGQFMLWGTDPNRPGTQGPIQWNDDNPSDGELTAPDECYDLTWSYPDSLGAMFYFTGDFDPDPCLDLTVDRHQAGSESVFTLSNLTPGATGAVLYSLQLGSFTFEGYGWNVDFGLQFNSPQDAQAHIVFQDTDTNDDGMITDSIYIPCAAGGLTIHFQGAAKGTDGPCMSDVVSVTFDPCG